MTLKSFLRMRLFVSLVGILGLWPLSSVLDFENCLKTEILPHYKMVDEFKRHYPYFFCEGGVTISGSFEEEALGERNRA